MGGSGFMKISSWAYHGQFPDGNLSGSASPEETDLGIPSVNSPASEIVLDEGFACANAVTRMKEADSPNKIANNIRMARLFFIFSSFDGIANRAEGICRV